MFSVKVSSDLGTYTLWLLTSSWAKVGIGVSGLVLFRSTLLGVFGQSGAVTYRENLGY